MLGQPVFFHKYLEKEKKMADGESTPAGLNTQQISQIQTAFNCDPKNQLSQNLGTRNDLLDLCLDRQVVEKTNHVFSHKVGGLTRHKYFKILY